MSALNCAYFYFIIHTLIQNVCSEIGLLKTLNPPLPLHSLSLFLQRVKSGREGSARGRREGREGSAGSAGESAVTITCKIPTLHQSDKVNIKSNMHLQNSTLVWF